MTRRGDSLAGGVQRIPPKCKGCGSGSCRVVSIPVSATKYRHEWWCAECETTARGPWCPTCKATRSRAGLVSDGEMWDRIEAEPADTVEGEWLRRHRASHGYG